MQFVDQFYDKSPIALRGEHQKLNAALAIAALKLDGFKPSSFKGAQIAIDDSAIARGLSTVEWPGRFQCWDKRTVIDGAHNPASARILAKTWREILGEERATLILAILSDKDLRGICEALTSIADSFLLPKIRSERAVDPTELSKVIVDLGRKSEIFSSFADAFDKARQRFAPILITGSLHFAGEALAYLHGKPAAFEECAQ